MNQEIQTCVHGSSESQQNEARESSVEPRRTIENEIPQNRTRTRESETSEVTHESVTIQPNNTEEPVHENSNNDRPPLPQPRRRRLHNSSENWQYTWPWYNEIDPLPHSERAFWKAAIYSGANRKFDPIFLDAFQIDHAPKRSMEIINWAINITPGLIENLPLQTALCAYVDEIRDDIKNDLKMWAIAGQSQNKEIYDAAHAINLEFRALI